MTENEFKSPFSALVWSLAMPGFGQVYNGQVILGLIFMFRELGSNLLSGLNLSIMESFHGDFQKAHVVIHFEWGMYYTWFGYFPCDKLTANPKQLMQRMKENN